MAQWSHAEKVLVAKLVYYGPALGGKTTNLQALHGITDPRGTHKLVSLKTADDRTLFFDLLPFDLGRIFGYTVTLKLFTVPGQVRYDGTRRLVLSGADAVIFVADSSSSRRDECRTSFDNLRYNMRANRLDPARVPVLLQCNKQDLPDAAPPEQVAAWLGMPGQEAFPAVAVHGRGVLETFVAAARRMLERLVLLTDEKQRREIDLQELQRGVDRAFAPHLARLAAEGMSHAASEHAPDAIVLDGEGSLEKSVQASLRLGDRLAEEQGRAARLSREVDGLRELGQRLRRLDPTFDPSALLRGALEVVARVVQSSAGAVLMRQPDGSLQVEASWGRDLARLTEADAGRELLARMAQAATPCLVDDLSAEGVAGVPFRAAASSPVDGAEERLLLALAPAPDGAFDEEDLRFLGTVAAHLAAGLDKARLYAEIAAQRDTLEERVQARTEALRQAHGEARALERVKDRFLSNLSHEMRSPLTGIVGAATCLRDYRGASSEEMLGTILRCADALTAHMDALFRVAHLESEGPPLQARMTAAAELLEQARQLAGVPASTEVLGAPETLEVDVPRLARALANLLDNAVKFSPAGSEILLRAAPALLAHAGACVEAVALSVLDRGPGVAPEDRLRIFAPFEQAGDGVTGKPAGLGVGLHEARAIARAHGGTLELHARPGGGSEFRLTVPLRAVPAPREVLRV
ncbi:MAG TPA: ATP-binding protein [Candidatus Polarisedimenticolaceae bacterium]|nr:ATP-binding protein [Candidatus Polarisedimenticolaceae bacterium]